MRKSCQFFGRRSEISTSPCRRVPHFLFLGSALFRTPRTPRTRKSADDGDFLWGFETGDRPDRFLNHSTRDPRSFFSAIAPTLVGAKQLPRMRGLRQERVPASIRDSRKVPGCTTPRHPPPRDWKTKPNRQMADALLSGSRTGTQRKKKVRPEDGARRGRESRMPFLCATIRSLPHRIAGCFSS